MRYAAPHSRGFSAPAARHVHRYAPVMADEPEDPLALQRAFMESCGLDGSKPVRAVGVSHYQEALAGIAGRKRAHYSNIDCEARLVPEPTNPKDPDAVAVFIGEDHVGYLPAGLARPAADVVPAEIVGGWRQHRHDANDTIREGSWGVLLWLGAQPLA